ncbi:MAG: hypothetical protein ACLRSO_04520 [Oliverpabstia sp.]
MQIAEMIFQTRSRAGYPTWSVFL